MPSIQKRVKRIDMIRRISDAKEISNIPPREVASIFKQGAILRLPYLEGRLLQASKNVKNFELKYKNTLNQLKANGLPEDAGYEMHEDFLEWEYWEDVLLENENIVKHVKELLKEVEEV